MRSRQPEQTSTVPVEILSRHDRHFFPRPSRALAGPARKRPEQAAAMESGKKQAEYYHQVVFKDMAELRVPVDKLEMIVDKEEWPMPSYGDLLFEV